MKPTLTCLAIAALTFSAFAQHGAEVSHVPSTETGSLETAGIVHAPRFIPEELMTGPLHRVSSVAYNDGMNNTYVLRAGNEEFEITGDLALRTRIKEIYAIDTLRRTSKSEEFVSAIAASGKQKVEGALEVVRDPVGTLTAIPKGASRFFGRVGEGLKSAGEGTPDGKALQSALGVSKAKAKLAADLGVSPYSHNEELQSQLTNAARAMAGGGLVLSLATAAVSGPAGTAITALSVNETLQQTLITSTPADLRLKNRKQLLELGVKAAQAEEFLQHAWYSPWHATVMTDAFRIMKVDPSVFLKEACEARTPEDGLYFFRLSQVLVTYQKTRTPIREYRAESGVICALDEQGNLVVPISCDYAIWNAQHQARVQEFVASVKGKSEIKSLALWVDGAVSDRFAKEIAASGIEFSSRVLSRE